MQHTSDSPRDGSSSRVRGTGRRTGLIMPRSRFIPACAGNRLSPPNGGFRGAVHPRVCGEQPTGIELERRYRGSSPRVRGTARKPVMTVRLFRFIPACAGNSSPGSSEGCQKAVHPRVCGEQQRIVDGEIPRFGSSPRVRGTGDLHRAVGDILRFIPACAGNRH